MSSKDNGKRQANKSGKSSETSSSRSDTKSSSSRSDTKSSSSRADTKVVLKSASVSSAQLDPPITYSGIAEQICFLAKQTKQDNTRFTPNEVVNTDNFGKKRRLYSEINARPDKKNFIVSSVNHAFPINRIFFVPGQSSSAVSSSQQLIQYTPNDVSGGRIQIEAMPLTLTRSDKSGATYNATMNQTASFDIVTGQISIELREPNSKLLYVSKYKINDMSDLNAKIILDPFTTDETKIIRNNQRTKTVLSRLNGPKVNIYTYLNFKLNISSSSASEQISMTSTLEEIKAKFSKLKPEFDKLKSRTVLSDEEKMELRKYNFVESVLATPDTLSQYNRQLTKWFNDYNAWTRRGDLIVDRPEKQEYILEHVQQGKPRLSNYMIRLLDRVSKYDSRIVTYEDSEVITDYSLRENAEREQIRQRESLEELRSRNIPTFKGNEEANRAARKAREAEIKEAERLANIPISERMKVRVPLVSVDGTFGVYPPYLVSDILRYGSSFLKLNVVDSLCLTSENIQQFSEYINGFKSLVFNVASLYWQLALHKRLNFCGPETNPDTADLIINFSYSASIYSELSWLKSKSDRSSSLMIENKLEPIKLLESSAKASSSKEASMVPVAAKASSSASSSALSTTSSALSSASPSSESASEYNISKNINHWIRFKPCDKAKDAINILANEPTEGFKIVPLILLPVDEPIFGDDQFDRIQDFDLLYAKLFKPRGIASFVTSFFDVSLGSNFVAFVEKRYNYMEDLDESKPVQEASNLELNDMNLFPYLEREKPIESRKLLTDIPELSSTVSESAKASASIWAKFDKEKAAKIPDPVVTERKSVPVVTERKSKQRVTYDYESDSEKDFVMSKKDPSSLPSDTVIARPDDIFERQEDLHTAQLGFNDRRPESRRQYRERQQANKEKSEIRARGYESKEAMEKLHKKWKLDGLTSRIFVAWVSNKKYKQLIRNDSFNEEIINGILDSLYDNNLAQFNKLTFNRLQELVAQKATAIPNEDYSDIDEEKGEVFKIMKEDLESMKKPFEEAALLVSEQNKALAMSRQKTRLANLKMSKGKNKQGQGRDYKLTGGYYEKYLKYKTKYLELKAKLNL